MMYSGSRGGPKKQPTIPHGSTMAKSGMSVTFGFGTSAAGGRRPPEGQQIPVVRSMLDDSLLTENDQFSRTHSGGIVFRRKSSLEQQRGSGVARGTDGPSDANNEVTENLNVSVPLKAVRSAPATSLRSQPFSDDQRQQDILCLETDFSVEVAEIANNPGPNRAGLQPPRPSARAPLGQTGNLQRFVPEDPSKMTKVQKKIFLARSALHSGQQTRDIPNLC